jgi:hypothetical protein
MATIIVPSQKVIEAATKTIADIKAERKKRNEETIAKHLGKRAFSFRRGFYRMNREETIAWLDNNIMFGWRSQYAWGDLEKAKKLLNLAKHGDPVTLNEEDCRVLF